jgi:hypothetical protein
LSISFFLFFFFCPSGDYSVSAVSFAACVRLHAQALIHNCCSRLVSDTVSNNPLHPSPGIIKSARTVSVCMHRFCKDCIEAWLRSQRDNLCPQCRHKFASRRDCKPDPQFDLLVAAIFGDAAAFEEQTLQPDSDMLERAMAVGKELAEAGAEQRRNVPPLPNRKRKNGTAGNAVHISVLDGGVGADGDDSSDTSSSDDDEDSKDDSSGRARAKAQPVSRKGSPTNVQLPRPGPAAKRPAPAVDKPTPAKRPAVSKPPEVVVEKAAPTAASRAAELLLRGAKARLAEASQGRLPAAHVVLHGAPGCLAWHMRHLTCPASATVGQLSEAIAAGLSKQHQGQQRPSRVTLAARNDLHARADFNALCSEDGGGNLVVRDEVTLRDLVRALQDPTEALELEYGLLSLDGVEAEEVKMEEV